MVLNDPLLIAGQKVVLPGTAPHSLEIGAAALEIDPRRGLIRAVHRLPEGTSYRTALRDLEHRLELSADEVGAHLLSPAFVDAHMHLGLVMLRGTGVQAASAGNVVEDLIYKAESHLEAADIAAFVRMGAYEALLSGTGLVWEHYFEGAVLAETLREMGLCAVVGPTLEDRGGPAADQWQAQLETTLNLASGDGHDGIFACLAPHAADTVTEQLWAQVAREAEQHTLPVHAHIAQSPEEVRRVAHGDGTTPVQLIARNGVLDAAPSTLLVHALFLDHPQLEILSQARGSVHMGWCPRSQQIFGFAADPTVWETHGLPWVLATDCAASNDAASIPRELAAAAALRGEAVAKSPHYARYLEGSLSLDELWKFRQASHELASQRRDVSELLAHVWSIPGALHPRFRAGVIAPGALANLALWDLEHPCLWPAEDPLRALVMSNPVSALGQVMTRGQWRGERGHYASSIRHSADYQEAQTEASARRKALLAKLR